MRRIFLSFLALMSIATFFSCEEDNSECDVEDVATPFAVPCHLTSDLDTVKMQVEGTWTWVQAEVPVCFNPSQYFTPKTEGYSLRVDFKDGKATYYRCNQVTKVNRYSILQLKDVEALPGGEDSGHLAVIAFYDIETGKRLEYSLISVCDNYMEQQRLNLSGTDTWRRVN